MKYPKESLIQGIIFIVGLNPYHDQRKKNFGKIISIPGIILSFFHIFLFGWSFVIDSKRNAVLSNSTTQILVTSLFLKKLLNLIVPIIIILERLWNRTKWDTLWVTIKVFDEYLKVLHFKDQNLKNQKYKFTNKINKANFWFGMFVVIVESINALLAIVYYKVLAPKEMAKWEVLYFYHFGYVIFMGCVMNICARIYSLWVRMDCFVEVLEGICREKWSVNIETNDLRMKMLKEYIERNKKEMEERSFNEAFERKCWWLS